MSTNIAVIYGSVRSERQGIKAVEYFKKKLGGRKINCTIVDPKEFTLPFLDKMYKEYDTATAPKNMKLIAEIFTKSDGFLIVTGEYNHSIPPALNNLLCHFQKEFFFKPSAIVSYSAANYGGVRAAVHLRAILGELGTPSIPSMFPIAQVQNSFDDKGNSQNEIYDKRAKRFLDEFVWYIEALKSARNKGVPY